VADKHVQPESLFTASEDGTVRVWTYQALTGLWKGTQVCGRRLLLGSETSSS
jgi:hypothetical protein